MLHEEDLLDYFLTHHGHLLNYTLPPPLSDLPKHNKPFQGLTGLTFENENLAANQNEILTNRCRLSIRILEGLAAHRIDPDALRSLISLVPQTVPKCLLGIGVRSQATVPFIELELQSKGYACVRLFPILHIFKKKT